MFKFLVSFPLYFLLDGRSSLYFNPMMLQKPIDNFGVTDNLKVNLVKFFGVVIVEKVAKNFELILFKKLHEQF